MYTFKNRSQVWDTVGMWAWLFHRITGLALVFYIILHIVLMGTSLLRGPETFNSVLGFLMGSTLFLILDLLLAAAVLYHGLNGIRILLFDIGIGFNRQKEIFWVLMAAGLVIYLFLLWRVLPEIF
ncbi:succinate dehydrogenase, cytochrome b556 subunit [Desulfofundulus kuznetsovii DSM 6115]|uniref:Succinate dehydrogenase, cytochrome b556 subunit n=2 Tax=Desulfofundulus TaxID=2282741 RepID=A0AAU8Q657_DESK7|nr:succinate dehydrogenase, cytochrome b556 subunit [Desulfofundulus luciae]AEG16738.1 succinate dehydrogenase, cytochrome b556 subunit [Desulfofundulus kuznetsovii DSM 6115]MDQ0286178.1 succinate dehydrogenase / fumarate reductase cytochrome b subunit [Desulfofundulus luciae]